MRIVFYGALKPPRAVAEHSFSLQSFDNGMARQYMQAMISSHESCTIVPLFQSKERIDTSLLVTASLLVRRGVGRPNRA